MAEGHFQKRDQQVKSREAEKKFKHFRPLQKGSGADAHWNSQREIWNEAGEVGGGEIEEVFVGWVRD